MAKGIVKWFSSEKGYGFITPSEKGPDVFVHFSGIQKTGGRADLFEGQTVEFNVTQGKKGPQAADVRVIG